MPTSGASSALLIHVSGHDKPGLTHALTSILGRHNVRVLDIGQAVIHDGLALGILIELTDEMRSSALLTDLHAVLTEGRAPAERRLLQVRRPDGAIFWRFR